MRQQSLLLLGIKPGALRGAVTATNTAVRHAAEVGSKNEMPPKKNRAVGRGRNDAINSTSAERHSVAAVRARK